MKAGKYDHALDSRNERALALLIDADNTPANIIGKLLDALTQRGWRANVRRMYANWTTPRMQQWKQATSMYAIDLRHRFHHTSTGKNATDIALVIDAMDLLHTENFDGFCLASSDSDFTPLAMRLRENGVIVYGVGRKETPQAFVNACSEFIHIEDWSAASTTGKEPAAQLKEKTAKKKKATSKKTTTQLQADTKLIQLLHNSVETLSGDNEEWVNLSTVGKNILNKSPEFTLRNYGYSTLGKLVRATDLYEVQPKNHAIYIRPKPQ